MKLTRKFYQPALALLFVVAFGTVSAQAQKGADEKVVLPPSPSPPLAQAPLLPLPVKPVADTLAPAGWTRYEVGEPALFSLLLPAEPGASAERVDVMHGVLLAVRTYMSPTDSGVYGATYVDDLPAATMNEMSKRTFFEGFVKGFAEGFEREMKTHGATGTLQMSEQRTATMSGLAGYEQDFSFDKLQGRVRLVFDGGRAYAVLAFWNALSSNSERNTFFESLKVNRKR
ncbi:MAG TPA: hypothetical protein VGO96_08310 [Pyrinomonadaceae bacterium]|jgi:hypothetical protein|nr:hypothetical protein [Pyrinomonadaceae bacterium]